MLEFVKKKKKKPAVFLVQLPTEYKISKGVISLFRQAKRIIK